MQSRPGAAGAALAKASRKGRYGFFCGQSGDGKELVPGKGGGGGDLV